MTVFVTGGAGFIGGNFIHYHLAEHPEDRVVCIDKLTYAGNLTTLASVMDNPNFRFCKLDICDREGVFNLFEEEKPEVVIITPAIKDCHYCRRGIPTRDKVPG